MRLWITLLVAFAPAVAVAQSAQDRAAATALFDEGKTLMASGKIEEGCARFAASLKLVKGLGTQLNLADCHEKLGRLATAWAEFRLAWSQASKAGDRRAAYARQRADALEPRLPRLIFHLAAGADLPGLEIKRGDTVLPRAVLDTPVPVDPGHHVVSVSAPGHEPWSQPISATEGKTITVEVPVLTESEKPPPPPESAPVPAEPEPGPALQPGPPAASDRVSDGGALRITGVALGVAGLAAVGVGVKFGLDARAKADDITTHSGTAWTADDNVTVSDGQSAQNRMYLLVGVGGAALVTGVTLYVLGARAHARAHRERTAWRPMLGPGVAGVLAEGSF